MPQTRIIKEPSQARARARRDKILASTLSLLLEGGPDAVTTTAIAAAAEIPVGSVYRYFEDKDHILRTLYGAAYSDIETGVSAAMETAPTGCGFRKTHRHIIRAFWRTARKHPSFRPLTRWANSHGSLWDVTPGLDSSLAAMVTRTLEVAGTSLPEARRTVMMRTMVTTLSVLIDQAIEEEDEEVAEALILEITEIFAGYLE
jgi:AcrR family transcriptional regulator